MVAMKCGAEDAATAKFCAACGAPFDAAGVPATTVTTSMDGPAIPAGPSHRRGRKVAIAALVLALAASLGCARYYIGVYRPEQERAMQEQALKTEKCDVVLAVSAVDWDTSAGASRMALRVQGETLAGDHVDNIMHVDSDGRASPFSETPTRSRPWARRLRRTARSISCLIRLSRSKIPAEAKKDETVVVSPEYKLELTPIEALDVTDDILASDEKYTEGVKDSEADGYNRDAEALVAFATKRRDDAVAAKQAADEAAAKAEQERKAVEEAERAA